MVPGTAVDRGVEHGTVADVLQGELLHVVETYHRTKRCPRGQLSWASNFSHLIE